MVERLDSQSRDALLQTLPKWTVEGERLRREFLFKDFKHAFSFMQHVADLAEAHNHHPDWSNSWNKVEISLTTHEANGLTQRDVDLATAIDRLEA